MHFRKTSVHQQDLLGLLNAEYEKLRQLRLDQCNSLKSQWDNYQDQQRKNRKKEIQKRQIEFDKELEISDKERRKHWTVVSRHDVDTDTKRALCEELLERLSAITAHSNETDVQNLSVSQENDESHANGKGKNSDSTATSSTHQSHTTTSSSTKTTITETGVDTAQIQVLNNTQNHLGVDTSVLTIPIPLLESFWILDINPPVTLSDVQSTIDSITKLKDSDL
jgi:hypothetical protein